MLYIAYLDEFGHLGPYINKDDPKHNTHPVFGLAGFVLPYSEVRTFSTYFFQLKNNLLSWELNQSGRHPAKWEKKGSALYTLRNIQTYPELRKATFRLLKNIIKRGGFLFYVGTEKQRNVLHHNSKKLYSAVLKETIKRLDQECTSRKSEFLFILDEHQMRTELVEASGLAMFGNEQRKCLIEPPFQVESHLYQTLQCADWICGLIGRLSNYWCEPDERKELADFEKYFAKRIQESQLRSGIRRLS